ncbi:MAG TPA: hypothetical protein VFX15_00315 [Actinomycetes bacterium]|nr:hypothetical protein [Actinomycetes bacterium]
MSDEAAEDFFDPDAEPRPVDFRRANGSPLVRRLDGSGRWDRYARPSGFGHDLDDESALNNWRIDRAIEGVATTPSLAAAIAANIGRKEGRKDRREQAITVGRGEEAADLGTALHAMAHRLETEEGFRAPPPYDADLAAYLTALDSAGLVSTYCECHICADRWRAAGTADRIYQATRELQLPDGSVMEPGQSVIGDLKTGKTLQYSLPGYAIQLAVYADGCFYDVVTDERTSLPDGMRLDWGLLVHLPVGQARCDLLWVDLEVGRHGAALVAEVRDWRKRSDFARDFAYPASDEVAVLSSPIYDLEAEVRAARDGEPEPTDELDGWTTAMLGWCRYRVNVIGRHSDARAMLLRKWPPAIPPLLADGHTAAQVSEILGLLDLIESAYDLPFPDGDPRLEWNRGLHRSEVPPKNEPRSNVQ